MLRDALGMAAMFAHPRRSGVPDRAIARDRGSGPQAGADPPHDPQNRTGMACPCIDPCPRISIIALNQGCCSSRGTHLPLHAWVLADRKSVVWGKSVSERVDLGGRRFIKTKQKNKK